MTTATVIETARVEQLVQGDHEYDRRWETADAAAVLFVVDRRREPNIILSEWLHDAQPPTGTYRLICSWGARSDEVRYRSQAA